MTQKELAYFEDAISHEGNIIKIFEELLGSMDDQDLINFMQEEIDNHKNRKERLTSFLEGLNNE